jgi:hypothetical protein
MHMSGGSKQQMMAANKQLVHAIADNKTFINVHKYEQYTHSPQPP